MITTVCEKGHRFEVSLEDEIVCPYCNPQQKKTLSFGDRYTKKAKIGEGGMGNVYLVYDEHLKRHIALKQLKGNSDEERFLREIELLAQLKHQNIVTVLDFNATGVPYYTMELIDGVTIDQYIGRHKDYMQIAKLFVSLCHALDSFHAQNIIHRDIKPDNIIVDKNGLPKIVDFGLAKDLSQAKKLSLTGDFIGTREYMSPEQRQNSLSCNFQSDIYSLAATMYKVLTDTSPYQENLNIDLVRPCHRNPNIPKDLESICLKGLQRKSRRYQHAREMVEDLQQFVDKKPLLFATPPNFWTRIDKLLYRHPIAVCLVSLFVIATIAFAGFFFFQWSQTEKQRQQTRHYLQISQQSVGESYTKEALSRIEKNEYFKAKLLAGFAIGYHNQRVALLPKDSPQWLQCEEILTKYPDIRLLWHSEVFDHHRGYITDLCFVSEETIASASMDTTIKIWKKNKLHRTLRGHKDVITDISYSSTYNALISCSRDKTIRIWDLEKGTDKTLRGHTRPISSISCCGELLVSVDYAGGVKIWNLSTQQEMDSWRVFPTSKVLLLPDQKHVLIACIDKSVRLWNVKAKTQRIFHLDDTVTDMSLRGHSAAVISTCKGSLFFFDGEKIQKGAVTSPDSILRVVTDNNRIIFSTKSTIYYIEENQLHILCEDAPQMYAIAIHGEKIVWGGNNRIIQLHKHQKHLPKHVNRVNFSSQGKHFLAVENTKLHLWNVKTKKQQTFSWGQKVIDACFHPQDPVIVILQQNGIIRKFNWHTKISSTSKQHQPYAGKKIFFHAKTLVSFGKDGIFFGKQKISEESCYDTLQKNNQLFFYLKKHQGLFYLNVESKKLLLQKKNVQGNFFVVQDKWFYIKNKQHIYHLKTNNKIFSSVYGKITDVSIAKNGIIAIATQGNRIYLFDAQREEIVGKIDLIESTKTIAFAPDGKKLLVGGHGYVSLWEILFDKSLESYTINSDQIMDARFHPRNKHLAIAKYHGFLQIMDRGNGKSLLETYDKGQERAHCAYFIDDSRVFLGRKSTLEVWNTRNKKMEYVKKVPNATNTAFSPFGFIASKTWDGPISIYKYHKNKISKLSSLNSLVDNSAPMVFCHKGKTLISSVDEGEIAFWDTDTGKELQILRGHSDIVSALAVSPDEKWLASGSHDGTVKVWSMLQGRLYKNYLQNESVLDIIWDHNSEIVIATGTGGVIKIWKDEKPVVLQAHRKRVFSLDIHPKNNIFLSASYNDIKLWSVHPKFVNYQQYLKIYHVNNFSISWDEQAFLNSSLTSGESNLFYELK